jgi:hypothetical protein
VLRHAIRFACKLLTVVPIWTGVIAARGAVPAAGQLQTGGTCNATAIAISLTGPAQQVRNRHAPTVFRNEVARLASASYTCRDLIQQTTPLVEGVGDWVITSVPARAAVSRIDVAPNLVAKPLVDAAISVIVEPIAAFARDYSNGSRGFRLQRGAPTAGAKDDRRPQGHAQQPPIPDPNDAFEELRRAFRRLTACTQTTHVCTIT